MTERVSYEAQVNQIPAPYYYPQQTVPSKKRKYGTMLIGGLLGMNAYYLPVSKDTFVQRGFDRKRDDNFDQIRKLKTVAEEIEKENISTESKMILQEMGLPEDVSAITAKCVELEKEVTDPSSVQTIKGKFISSFENFKKKTHKMDAECSDAFRAAKWNKFKWGVGIGAGIGLALGLLSSRE